MKKELSVLMSFIMLSMALTLAKPASAAAPTNGPRADALHINIYANDALEFAAFEAEDIDIVDTPLDPTHVADYSQAPKNASIIVSKYNEIGMYEFDINNNETIQARPGVKTATSNPYFRAALACLADKDYIVTNILGGYAARLDGPIMPWMGSYYDPDVHKFSYNPLEAYRYLTLGGFVDRDLDGIINYPVGWPDRETGPNLDDLLFYIRLDDTYRRLPAGLKFAADLEAHGIPVDARPVPRSVTSVEVMTEHNFDMYTGGWSLSRDPDWMYYLYHSMWYHHPGPDQNYNHFHDALMDGYLEDIAFATTIPEAVTATHNAQKRGWNAPDDAVPGIVVHIPLWATAGYTAYRRPMAYAVNAAATGTTNGWTMLASYNTTNYYGNTIRWGFKSDVQQLNPLYSNWVWDNYVLGEIFDGVLAVNPYNLALDMPWVASAYETTAYINPELGECSRVILTIRDGVRWHDGTPLTAADVKFSYDYIHSFPDCWLYSATSDIVSTTVVGNQVIIDFDVLSVWALHWSMGIYLLPKHIYETILDPHGFTPGDLPAEQVLIGSGPYKWYQYSSGEYFTLLANRDYFKEIHRVGDVDFDGVCDYYDLLVVAASIGSCRGEARYDIRADITGVGDTWDFIDLYDLLCVYGNLEVGPPGVSVTDLESSKTAVGQGYSLRINTTVQIQRAHEETFNVTIFANATSVASQTVTLSGYDSATLIFTWNTTGFPFGNYTISAVADTVPGETDTADNTLSDGTVYVGIPGDVNGDGVVDVFDLILVASAYGSTPTDPNWNTNADINADGTVDIYDLILVASHYGETTP